MNQVKSKQEFRKGLDEKGVLRKIKIQVIDYPNNFVQICTDWPIFINSGTIKFQGQLNTHNDDIIVMEVSTEKKWWEKISILETAIKNMSCLEVKTKLQIKSSYKILIKKGANIGIYFLKPISTEKPSKNKKKVIYFDV